jgi:hypothetical protein
MIGSTVNPTLGRIDYSPIVQGAQAAAQGIQNAGQITGQMYSNLGSTIGNQLTTSVQQYQKNKEERDILQSRATSNIGQAIQSMNNFKSDPAAYGNKAPIRPEMLESVSIEDIPKISLGKLKAFVSETDKLLEKPRAIEGFIQQQAVMDAINKQRNTRIASAYDAPQSNAPFYLARPMQPDTPEALTKRLVEAGLSFPEAIAAAKAPYEIRKTEAEIRALGAKQPALPSYQQQRLDTEVAAFTNKYKRQPNADELASIFSKIDQGILPNPYASKVAEGLYNEYKTANSAVQQFESINNQISMIDKGNLNVGFTGEISQGIDKLRSIFGDKQAAERVSNTEIIESVLGRDLMSAINTAGLTTRSFDTPAEMKNLRSAFVGGTTLTPQAIKTIAIFRRGVVQTLVNDYNQKVENGVYDQLGEALRQPVKKIKLPTVINSITPR